MFSGHLGIEAAPDGDGTFPWNWLAMNPQKVRRDKLGKLEDLPNIGKAMAADLRCIGIRSPEQLVGQDPLKMYEALCERTGGHHDPCVIDVFMSIVHFMDGGDALPWWAFTAERKRRAS